MKNNYINQVLKTFAAVCMAFCVIILFLSVILLSNSDLITVESAEIANAAASTGPTVTHDIFLLEEYYDDNVGHNVISPFSADTDPFPVDISDGTWKSYSAGDKEKSLLQKLGLVVYFSEYNYETTCTTYTDQGKTKAVFSGGHDNPEIVTETVSPYSEARFMNSSEKVTAITVSGTTWYGDSVSNYNILGNDGKNAVAGRYKITSITYNYYITYTYTESATHDYWNYTGGPQGGGTYDDQGEVEAKKTKPISGTVTVAPCAGDESINLFLYTNVSIGSNFPSNNLGLSLTYDSETEWDTKISLYSSWISENNSEQFSYANVAGLINTSGKYGFSSTLYDQSFTTTQIIGNGKKVADCLKIVWYYDEGLTLPVKNEPGIMIVDSGTYYLHWECADAMSEDFTLEQNDEKINAVAFLKDSKEYVQKITIDKITLKVSIKDDMGLGFQSYDEYGEIKYIKEVAFSSSYALVALFYSQINTAIPSGEYYIYSTELGSLNNPYVLADGGQFDVNTPYYLNNCSMSGLIINTLAKAGENVWTEMGGCSSDYEYAVSGDLFNLNGSYFEGTAIKDYDSVIICMSIAKQEISKNYEFDLGQYVDETWVSYATETASSQQLGSLLQSGKVASGEVTQKKYKYYDSFTITAPELALAFNYEFDPVDYGQINSSSEIDYSGVKLTSGAIPVEGEEQEPGLYDLNTSGAAWRVKIVSDVSEMVISGDYSYLFILMQLGVYDELGEFQDLFGNRYSYWNQTIVAGDYYIIYSLYYRQKGDTTATNVTGCRYGKISVRIGGVGIATVSLPSPATITVNRVTLYLDVTDLVADKYYDGTATALDSFGRSAQAEIKQQAANLSSYYTSQNCKTIFEYDLKHDIKASYTIEYASYCVNPHGELIDIIGNIRLMAREGASSLAERIIESYDIEFSMYENGVKKDFSGEIKRRILDIMVLKNPDRIVDIGHDDYTEQDYSSGYGSSIRVALKVADHSQKNANKDNPQTLLQLYINDRASTRPDLPEIVSGKGYYADLYYYDGGFFYYAALPGIFENQCYLLLGLVDTEEENHGFLSTTTRKEGFVWDEYDDTIAFNMDDSFSLVDVAISEFFDWENSVKKVEQIYTAMVLNVESNSGKYWLKFKDELYVTNYEVKPYLNSDTTNGGVINKEITYLKTSEEGAAPQSYTEYFAVGIEITKIKLTPEQVFIINGEDSDSGRILNYDGSEKIYNVFIEGDLAFVTMESKHPDYEVIRADLQYRYKGEVNFSKLVEVISVKVGVETEDPDDDYVYEGSNITEEMRSMRIAGQYTVRYIAPETENYKQVIMEKDQNGNSIVLQVYCAQVSVYSTVAVRTYMSSYDSSKEVHFDGKYKMMTMDELIDYTAYIDINTYEVSRTKDLLSSTPVYVMYVDDDKENGFIDTSSIWLYYIGIVPGDSLVGEKERSTVYIDDSIFNGKDQAGMYSNAITIKVGSKQNYIFNPVPGPLYVRKQSIVMKIEPNQEIYYTGNYIEPKYSVITEDGDKAPATINKTVAAYYAKNTDGKYEIYVMDFATGELRIAECATNYEQINTKDYYFYFESFGDAFGHTVEVKQIGDGMYAIVGSHRYFIYTAGSSYYYRDEERNGEKVSLQRTVTYVYQDGNGYCYYLNNDESTSKQALSFEPDFNIKVDDQRMGYIALCDGKKIYIAIRERTPAISAEGEVLEPYGYENDIINVFYSPDAANNGNKGGYILMVLAQPSETGGGDSSNYEKTNVTTIFIDVAVTKVVLRDNMLFNTDYLDSEYQLEEFGQYFVGKINEQEFIELAGYWADLEIVRDGLGIPQFAYYENQGGDFASEAEEKFNLYFDNNTQGVAAFVKASTVDAQIKNAGLYIILVKATLSSAAAPEGSIPVDMTKNLYFESQKSQLAFDGNFKVADKKSETYFVLKLIINRSSDLALQVTVSDNVYINGDKAFCQDKMESYVLGYGDIDVKFVYDECNPFGMIAGQFGAIKDIPNNTNKTASEQILNEFNDLGDKFNNYMSLFDFGTEDKAISVDGSSLETYGDLYDTVKNIFGLSLMSFVSKSSLSLENGMLIGVNYSNYMNFGAEISDLSLDYQKVAAHLFGFNDKQGFLQYAERLATEYKIYRSRINNPKKEDAALGNGCFYTNSGTFVFPFAIKNNISQTVLVLLFIDPNDRVSVWVHDIKAALWATNISGFYHTGALITNELYCKNLLFVTGYQYSVYYQKMYDATELSLGENLFVMGKESSKGEVLNVRAYLSTLAEPTINNDYLYFVTNKTTNGEDILYEIIEKWNQQNHPEINLVHANKFYITFIVNYNDKSTYNNNYITYYYTCKVEITKRSLDIYLTSNGTLENPEENSYKYFGEENSSVNDNFSFIYSNWASEADKNALEKTITGTKVDWSSVSSDSDPEGILFPANGSYYLFAKDAEIGGISYQFISNGNTVYKTFNDYTFDYSSTLVFTIKTNKLVYCEDETHQHVRCVVVEKSHAYAGRELIPSVTRYGYDGKDLNEEGNIDQLIVGFGIEVKCLGKILNYNPDVKYDEHSTVAATSSVISIGHYLFSIEIAASTNYDGLEKFYVVFEITKNQLILKFDGNSYASMTYNGIAGSYPEFKVTYEIAQKFPELDGENRDEEHLTGVYRISFKPDVIPEYTYEDYGISNLALIHPLYVFVNQDTGEELIGAEAKPVNAGKYYIKAVFAENQYGYAANYDIIVDYGTNIWGKTNYPELEITKRKVGVYFDTGTNELIKKTYDGTNVVIDGSVNAPSDTFVGNYTFTPQNGETGIVRGDIIGLNVSGGKYARATVLDEYEEASVIDVYLNVNTALMGLDKDNYILDFSMCNLYVEGDINYIVLQGTISRAKATVKFYQNINDEKSVTTIKFSYNGEAQEAPIKVFGVADEILTMEANEYTVEYSSNNTKYHNTLPPTNSDSYEVTVTVNNPNYLDTPQIGYMIIGQAHVTIKFSGEATQMYGNVTVGLSAVANGEGGYANALGVTYYYILSDGGKGDLVPDISSAPAGTYIAEAIHLETDNFCYEAGTEIFTITRRDTAINYDVPSKFKYNGSQITIKMYFVDSGNIYYPELIFDMKINGEWKPYNYNLVDGKPANIKGSPVNAGEYRVQAYAYLDNFYVTDPVWCNFVIEKSDAIVQVIDTEIVAGEQININYKLINSMSNSEVQSEVSNMKFKYYTINGEELKEAPTEAGLYKIVAYGGESTNYSLTYVFGILTINQKFITAVAEADSNIKAEFEGSYSASTQINISKKQNTDYADINEAFDSLKKINDEYSQSYLQDVYVFTYDGYTPTASGGTGTIRLHAPGLFANETAETQKIKVLVLAEDGSVSVVECQVDGDYLVITPDDDVMVRAISVLSDAQKTEDGKLAWLLYVGIALAVVVLGAAIFLVIKKA